jgi:putative holliday junction resolvase
VRHNQEYLGVDVGAARVGIARGGSFAKIAQPLKTLAAATAIDDLGELAANITADGIVVGLPRGLDGQETVQTKTVRHWVKTAQAKIGLPFYWQDEALSSHLAESQKNNSAAGADAAAAAIILQDFLDSPPDERVRC